MDEKLACRPNALPSFGAPPQQPPQALLCVTNQTNETSVVDLEFSLGGSSLSLGASTNDVKRRVYAERNGGPLSWTEPQVDSSSDAASHSHSSSAGCGGEGGLSGPLSMGSDCPTSLTDVDSSVGRMETRRAAPNTAAGLRSDSLDDDAAEGTILFYSGSQRRSSSLDIDDDAPTVATRKPVTLTPTYHEAGSFQATRAFEDNENQSAEEDQRSASSNSTSRSTSACSSRASSRRASAAVSLWDPSPGYAAFESPAMTTTTMGAEQSRVLSPLPCNRLECEDQAQDELSLSHSDSILATSTAVVVLTAEGTNNNEVSSGEQNFTTVSPRKTEEARNQPPAVSGSTSTGLVRFVLPEGTRGGEELTAEEKVAEVHEAKRLRASLAGTTRQAMLPRGSMSDELTPSQSSSGEDSGIRKSQHNEEEEGRTSSSCWKYGALTSSLSDKY